MNRSYETDQTYTCDLDAMNQLLLQWPTENTGPNGVIPLDLTYVDLMGELPRPSMIGPRELSSTPKVSLRSLSDCELSRLALEARTGINVLNSLPKPSKCTEEQLAIALGYLYSLGDIELACRSMFITKMQAYLRDPDTKKPHKSQKLRNLAIYQDLVGQAIKARLQQTLARANASGGGWGT